jgi:hypothetical protein
MHLTRSCSGRRAKTRCTKVWKGEAMLERGTDRALAVDVLGLQALPSVGEVPQLGRRKRRRGSKTVNVCLVTLNDTLNDIDILNIFG